MPAFLGLMVSWLLRVVVVKFLIMAAVVALLVELVPVVAGLIAPFIGTPALSSAFSSISPGVWWFLDFCRLDIGVPAMLAAWVTRFIIRRIPFIG